LGSRNRKRGLRTPQRKEKKEKNDHKKLTFFSFKTPLSHLEKSTTQISKKNETTGGVFCYPADRKSKDGKLRLLYEGAPMVRR
jgi:hypothetical protein